MRKFLLGFVLLFCAPLCAQDTKLSEGADLQIFGRGAASGQFELLRDITFDAPGNLYVLDGGEFQKDAKQGNFRVQKFDAAGKFAAEFSVWNEALGVKNNPQRLAVDAAGNIYVTQPSADIVQQFSPDGKLLQNIALPRAMGIARVGNNVAAIASRNDVVNGKWTWQGGESIVLLPENKAVSLEKRLNNVQDLDVDKLGNFYVLAAINQIYKFSPDGKLLGVIGAGANTRNADGSEPLHSVAVNAKGEVFTMTWGNPGLLTRYDSQLKTVTQREGQFKWGDPWSTHSGYVPLAVDSQDRVWVASTQRHDPKGPNFPKYHVSPAISRLTTDYLDTDKSGTTRRSMLLLGFKPQLQIKLPYNIAYEPKQPINCEFIVAPANRRVKEVQVAWHVYDVYKKEWGKGDFKVALKDGEEARTNFTFTPPRFGWFTVEAEISANGERLLGIGAHGGVTPRYANMPVLNEGDSPGGWEDAPRQMFSGLPMMRLHPGKSLDKFDKDLQFADKWGAFVFAQLTDNKNNFTVEYARPIIERFKGRVKFWELMNEPNFSMSPEEYVKGAQPLYDMIHQLDPAAKVLGPAIVSLDLGWMERFYKAGGKTTCDILSMHDYEGHESIDPTHWQWKISALRKLMAQFGDDKKEIWQTERAICGVRGDNFLGPAQAVRVTLHRNLLETLGIPPLHNSHYYLNEGGYGPVPTYLWSSSGPHPGALALRTREAMTKGKKFVGTLDFGPTGNKMVLGLRYDGPDGSVYVIQNLGTDVVLPLVFQIGANVKMKVSDSFGNEAQFKFDRAFPMITLEQLPQYVFIEPGQKLQMAEMDWMDMGQNLASQAKFSYSGKTESDFALLNNGVMETIHAGNPNGGTDGKKIWQGELNGAPQTLGISFDAPKKIQYVVLFGVRPDNAFCSLLDYDLQVRQGSQWKTMQQPRKKVPQSDAVNTSGSKASIWMLDGNFSVYSFDAVTTDKIRLVARRTSFGFLPDETVKAWGNQIPAKLMLREIEIY